MTCIFDSHFQVWNFLKQEAFVFMLIVVKLTVQNHWYPTFVKCHCFDKVKYFLWFCQSIV